MKGLKPSFLLFATILLAAGCETTNSPSDTEIQPINTSEITETKTVENNDICLQRCNDKMRQCQRHSGLKYCLEQRTKCYNQCGRKSIHPSTSIEYVEPIDFSKYTSEMNGDDDQINTLGKICIYNNRKYSSGAVICTGRRAIKCTNRGWLYDGRC